jgi:deferrochelatase/peroxidase EfeB
MTANLDLADIQGNILTAYGRLGFPKARFLLFQIKDAAAGRAFLQAIRYQLTTALRWPSERNPGKHGPGSLQRPLVTMNVALNFWGLYALKLSTRTLRGLPDEFIDGMAARAEILGDDLGGDPRVWDEIWHKSVHMVVSLNAQVTADGNAVPELEIKTQELRALCEKLDHKVVLLNGHKGPQPEYQEASAVFVPNGQGGMQPIPFEHFGFRDAIGDPVFEGQVPASQMAEAARGQGRLNAAGQWEPLATGEFLLGHPDEAQEIAGHAMPGDFSRNGTFMAYRKLHQHVDTFRTYIDKTGRDYASYIGMPPEHGPTMLMAKMAGRWPDGVPLMLAPTWEDWMPLKAKREAAIAANDTVTLAALERDLTTFTFRDDPTGARCPFSAHVRRVNTRDMLDPYFSSPDKAQWMGSNLNNRRRILRRGLPYGDAPPGSPDADEHGVVMLVTCASLFRQFEFVQQQWINYGLDFNAGNDTCPIVGNHAEDAKFVIAGDATRPPFICGRIPPFVETRGGDYFFIPSMTALRMIADGVVDPT